MRRWLLPLEIAIAKGHGAALVAAAVLVMALTATVSLLWRQHAEERQLLARVQAAQSPDPANVAGPSRAVDDRERLAEFEQLLGSRAEIDAHLRKLFDTARRRGLKLDIGEYRLTTDNAGGFQRYEIVLPVEGRFPAIQSFGQQVLLSMPFAAIEEVLVRRDSVDAAVVEARLRFALYLRPDSNIAATQPTAQATAP